MNLKSDLQVSSRKDKEKQSTCLALETVRKMLYFPRNFLNDCLEIHRFLLAWPRQPSSSYA